MDGCKTQGVKITRSGSDQKRGDVDELIPRKEVEVEFLEHRGWSKFVDIYIIYIYIYIYNIYIYWVVATQIFLEFSSLFGEDSNFDEHIFQLGGSTTT